MLEQKEFDELLSDINRLSVHLTNNAKLLYQLKFHRIMWKNYVAWNAKFIPSSNLT